MQTLDDLSLDRRVYEAIRDAAESLKRDFPVVRVVLFGSVVRGENDEESDVDLLVVTRERPRQALRDAITHVIFKVNLRHGTNLSEVIVDRETWDHGPPSILPIHREVEEEGIPL